MSADVSNPTGRIDFVKKRNGGIVSRRRLTRKLSSVNCLIPVLPMSRVLMFGIFFHRWFGTLPNTLSARLRYVTDESPSNVELFRNLKQQEKISLF